MKETLEFWKSIFQKYRIKIYIGLGAILLLLLYLFLTRTGYLYEKLPFLRDKNTKFEQQIELYKDSLSTTKTEKEYLKKQLIKVNSEYDSLLKVKQNIKIIRQKAINKVEQMTDAELQKFFDERVK